MHLGYTWYIGKRFCKSSRVFFSTFSARNESMEFSNVGTNSLINSGEERESNTSSGSEMPVRTVSQKFIHPQWEEDVQRIMRQTNNDCRFRIFTLTNSPRQQRSVVGRKDSRLRYGLVHNFLKKLCYGSKKWRWLNQWMI